MKNLAFIFLVISLNAQTMTIVGNVVPGHIGYNYSENIKAFANTIILLQIRDIVQTSDTVRFSVYLRSAAAQFNLAAYQCAIDINYDADTLLSFNYDSASSQIPQIPPDVGIGILKDTIGSLQYKLTFASKPGNVIINSNAWLRFGNFKLVTHNLSSYALFWCITGDARTLFANINWTDIIQ